MKTFSSNEYGDRWVGDKDDETEPEPVEGVILLPFDLINIKPMVSSINLTTKYTDKDSNIVRGFIDYYKPESGKDIKIKQNIGITFEIFNRFNIRKSKVTIPNAQYGNQSGISMEIKNKETNIEKIYFFNFKNKKAKSLTIKKIKHGRTRGRITVELSDKKIYKEIIGKKTSKLVFRFYSDKQNKTGEILYYAAKIETDKHHVFVIFIFNVEKRTNIIPLEQIYILKIDDVEYNKIQS